MSTTQVPTNKTPVATYLADYFYLRLSWLCHKYGKSASGVTREAVEAHIKRAEQQGEFDDMPKDWNPEDWK